MISELRNQIVDSGVQGLTLGLRADRAASGCATRGVVLVAVLLSMEDLPSRYVR